MRVAVCFFGEPRSFRDALPYIRKTFLEPEEEVSIGVYIHTWDRSHQSEEESTGYSSVYPEDVKKLEDELRSGFNPKKLEIDAVSEVQKRFRVFFRDLDEGSTSSFYQVYSMFASLSLVGKEEYDYYVLLRLDTIYLPWDKDDPRIPKLQYSRLETIRNNWVNPNKTNGKIVLVGECGNAAAYSWSNYEVASGDLLVVLDAEAAEIFRDKGMEIYLKHYLSRQRNQRGTGKEYYPFFLELFYPVLAGQEQIGLVLDRELFDIRVENGLVLRRPISEVGIPVEADNYFWFQHEYACQFLGKGSHDDVWNAWIQYNQDRGITLTKEEWIKQKRKEW